MDAVKIMWLEYRERAEAIVVDTDLRAFASTSSEGDLLRKYQQAENKAKEARNTELLNTGNNSSIAIPLYYEAALLFSEIVDLIDPEKASKLTRLKSKYTKKEIIISFFVGVASSLCVTLILA